MKLPNATAAFIDIRKLVEYALDFDDPRGRHKARVFRAALNITIKDASDLKELILTAVADCDCTVGELDFYGQRYSVDCKIDFCGKTARIRTGWIVRRDEDFPRLTTVFVLKEEPR